jgi:general transcription factor 3C polypeptide 3 (transcription factor C subunit 4)
VYCFSKAIRLNPEDCDSIWERSSIYQKQERFEKAILGFKSVLDLVPFHMATIKELAKIYVRLGDPQAALDLFESALSTPLSEDEKKVLERKAQRKLQGNTSDASESTDDDQAEDDVFQDENEEVIGDYSLGAVVSNSSASRIGFEELNMMCELYFDLSDFSKASAVIIECIQKLKQLDLMSSENDSSHSIDQRIDELEIPVEIRVKLGICRLREDRISDAKV